MLYLKLSCSTCVVHLFLFKAQVQKLKMEKVSKYRNEEAGITICKKEG